MKWHCQASPVNLRRGVICKDHLPHWPPSISQLCRFPFVRKSNDDFKRSVMHVPSSRFSYLGKQSMPQGKRWRLSLSKRNHFENHNQVSFSWENEPNILSVTVKTVRLCFGCDVTLQMFLLFSCEKWKHQGTMPSTFTFFASYGKKVANVAHWHSVCDIHINHKSKKIKQICNCHSLSFVIICPPMGPLNYTKLLNFQTILVCTQCLGARENLSLHSPSQRNVARSDGISRSCWGSEGESVADGKFVLLCSLKSLNHSWAAYVTSLENGWKCDLSWFATLRPSLLIPNIWFRLQPRDATAPKQLAHAGSVFLQAEIGRCKQKRLGSPFCEPKHLFFLSHSHLCNL